MKKRCVIVGGAGIGNYERIRSYLRSDDYIIYCDCGLKHLPELSRFAEEGHGVGQPDLIIGDFDSWENPQMDVETIVLPTVKDDTDTVYALKQGIERGFRDFLLIGVVGGRFDHTLCNISILLKLESEGLSGVLIDDLSLMRIVSREPVYVEEGCKYFSLLNIDGTPHDISITGAKYNVDHAEISCDYQYGVSNEVAPGEKACVRVGRGRLLLVVVEME